MNLWIIFLTGLTTGGLSCLAMQGGLLASVIATQKQQEQSDPDRQSLPSHIEQNWKPVLAFLITKIIAHMILGLLLGLLGSVVTISLPVRLVFQGLAAVFMVATAANLLALHPYFRIVQMEPPASIRRFIRRYTKNPGLFAPAVLGVLTVLIPCGVTQAMEIQAIATGNPIQGAAIMGAFVLGTAPLFAGIGIATAIFSEKTRKLFHEIAALLLLGMALYGINGILEVLDTPITGSKVVRTVVQTLSPVSPSMQTQFPPVVDGKQRIMISITNRGYSPTRIVVKQGVPVELTLTSNGVYSCASEFTLKAFRIYERLGPTDTRIVGFTPTQKGTFTFSCSMGMYTGAIEVR